MPIVCISVCMCLPGNMSRPTVTMYSNNAMTLAMLGMGGVVTHPTPRTARDCCCARRPAAEISFASSSNCFPSVSDAAMIACAAGFNPDPDPPRDDNDDDDDAARGRGGRRFGLVACSVTVASLIWVWVCVLCACPAWVRAWPLWGQNKPEFWPNQA